MVLLEAGLDVLGQTKPKSARAATRAALVTAFVLLSPEDPAA